MKINIIGAGPSGCYSAYVLSKYGYDVKVYEEHSKNGEFGKLNIKKIPSRKPCAKPLTDTVIYWDGKVALCNHDWAREYPLGDVNSQSIREIWQGEKYHAVRLMHFKGKWDDEPTCKNCDHWQMYYTEKGIIGELYERISSNS
mgnify:CR=1 FL=1